jgi:hypothetical protein
LPLRRKSRPLEPPRRQIRHLVSLRLPGGIYRIVVGAFSAVIQFACLIRRDRSVFIGLREDKQARDVVRE